MIHEEKILDYLDGALGDKESAELMHQLSVSPERRVILEQHLQLKNVISDARKPFSVPAAVEAKLAERIPVIANYNRELAGATFVTTASRSPFFGRVAAGVVGLLLVGAVYFGFIRTSGEQANDVNATNETNGTNSSVNSGSEITTASPQAMSSGAQVNTPSSQVGSGAVTQTSAGNGSSNTRATSSGRNSGRQFAAPLATNDLPPHGGPVNDNTELIQQETTPVAETPQQNITVSPVDRLHTEPATTLYAPASMTLASLLHNDESSALPLTLRVDYSLGQSFNQMREADASVTTRNARAFSIGVDYMLTPHWAIGIEGGQTDVSRVEEIATVVDDEELDIKRVNISHDIRSHTEVNGRAMVRWTINPYDRQKWELSAGGGFAVNDKVSPLLSGSISASWPLSEAISFSASGTFTGTFTQSGDPTVTAVDVGNGPVAYVISDQTTASTLFTPSFLAKIGLRIKPW